MNFNSNTLKKIGLPIVLGLLFANVSMVAQETSNLNSSSTYHNQMFFNRFLINPTFSLVRENKSYLNILHRNQYATFDDNSQNYLLGFSNKLNDRTALGIGIYSQWSGVIQEFGFNANYATAVKLGDKSSLAFGTNITYFNQGLDKNRVIISETDPELIDARKESKIAIQPGINLSLGKFDIGLYAEDLLRYNQTTNEFLTNLDLNTVKASLQYTHSFMAGRGLFENARLMPLAQVGKNKNGGVTYLGSILLDLPNYGWLQSTYDDEYGVSAGIGFNLSKRMSIGYLMEKDLSNKETNLGWNHEISLAYTFKEDDSYGNTYANSSQDSKIDRIVRNYEEQIANLIAERDNERNTNSKKQKEKVSQSGVTAVDNEASQLAYENRMILDELLYRQDSLEAARTAALENRFETIVRLLRKDIKQTIEMGSHDNQGALATHTPSTNNAEQHTVLISNERKVSDTDDRDKKYDASAIAQAQQNFNKAPIKVLGDADLIGVKSGYYVIANVYSNKKYLKAFIENLHKKGINAKEFYNKENGLYYVYLADYNYKKDAQVAYVSDLNGQYKEEKWIMQVDTAMATASNTFEDDDY